MQGSFYTEFHIVTSLDSSMIRVVVSPRDISRGIPSGLMQ